MLSKDILKNPKTEYAVVNQRYYIHKTDRSPDTAGREKSIKVTLASEKYYVNTRQVNDHLDPHYYREAPASERNKGFLTIDDKGHSRVIPAKDLIGRWAPLEVKWNLREQEQETKEAESRRRSLIREKAEATVREGLTDLEANVRSSTQKLLGIGTPVDIRLSVGGDWNETFTDYTPHVNGSVALSVEQFQRLLEKVYEAQDALV